MIGRTINKFSERGSAILFFLVFMLPIIFIACVISLDLTSYYKQTNELQQMVDETGIYAYQFFPYTSKAIEAATKFLKAKEIKVEKVEVLAQEDAVIITASYPMTFAFASFFKPWGVDPKVQVIAATRVRGRPTDMLIAMDDSYYMGPSDEADNLEPDSGEWPAAKFFKNDRKFMKDDGTYYDARFITQRCFNSSFSALKLATIYLYEYIAGFKMNAIGLAFFPGVSPVEMARSLIRANDPADKVIDPGDKDKDPADRVKWGEALFIDQGNRFGWHRYCAGASYLEDTTVKYTFPDRSKLMSSLWKPEKGAPAIVLKTGDSSKGDIEDWIFNKDYAPYFSASQAIWSRTVQLASSGISGTSSILDMIATIKTELLPLSDNEGVASRGGLVNNASKVAIIMAGDVPYEKGVRFSRADDDFSTAMKTEIDKVKDELVKFDNLDLRVYYVVFKSRWNPSATDSDFNDRVAQLRLLFKEVSKIRGEVSPRFRFEVITGDTPEDLAEEVVGRLVLERRSAVLSR